MGGQLSGALFETLEAEQIDEVLAVVSRIVHPKGGASDWTLQKTYYLACVESIEDRFMALLAPRFFSWSYGPWSKDLRELMELAAAVGDVDVALVRSRYQTVTKVYRWPSKKELPPMRSSEDALFVDRFLSRVRRLPGEELTLLAKQTIPFKRTEAARPIDLEGYLAERKSSIERLSDDEKLAQPLAARGH